MFIKSLQINNFGKLNNKNIELNNGINIIYGENESGKSTLLKFITSMFYGISKNKNGKRISDYDKFIPWQEGEFSGKIKYNLDNNEEYEVYRNFTKKNPQILDRNGNDISKTYTIDKTYGNNFFFEQTKVDEELFNMSMVIMQQEVKLDEKKQNILIQKASNIMSTGEDDVSYLKVLAKLNKKQTEEIGTTKSPTKPLYLTKQKIEELNKAKKELENILPIKYELEDEKEALKKKISKSQNELEILQELQKTQNELNIEEEKIKINIKAKEEIEKRKKEIQETLDNIKINFKRKHINKFIYIIPISLTIISIILFIFKQKTTSFITGGVDILSIAIISLIIINNNKKYKKNYEEKIKQKNNIKNKIEILENEIKEKNKNIIEKQNEMETKKKILKSEIKRKYSNIDNIDVLLEKEIQSNNIIKQQNLINELKLKLNQIEINKEEITKKLENHVKIEEQLMCFKEELEELLKYNESIEIAKKSLENAYIKMRESITPRFTINLSNIVENISGGKYKTVKVNEQNELMVELQNGNYVSADVLSVGTIDQLYLALRISSMNELTKETMPIILDETFAYFDRNRLENILKFLSEEYRNRQIIIFTCTNRESQSLEDRNIRYNKIVL